MQYLAECVIKKLLTELRSLSSSAPSEEVYYARLFKGGYVSYYKMGTDGESLLSLDLNDPISEIEKINGKYIQKVEANPELKDAAEKLVKMGLLKVIDIKETYKDITSTYNKDIFPTPDDVPDVTQRYTYTQYSSPELTIKIDHTKKAVDLDINYKRYHARRQGTKREGPAYVIPSGDVAFSTNQLELQKMLKFLMQQDKRVTSDYRIIGDEKYRKTTVGQLVAKPDEIQSALTGRFKLTMFHGTSVARWKTIKKVGLVPGSGGDVYVDMVTGWSDKNIYLTFSHSKAENYATRQAIKDKSKAAVLRVEIPDVTKLVTDEDVFDFFQPKRTYNLKVMDRGGTNTQDTVIDSDTDARHVKLIMQTFGENRIVMDEEGKALYTDMMSYINNELLKKSLKTGSVGYRGRIPPKFIQLDMVYEKTPFKTPEKRGGPSAGEYSHIRKDVQAKASRYDESILRRCIRDLLSDFQG
jgi:hypothetical protein